MVKKTEKANDEIQEGAEETAAEDKQTSVEDTEQEIAELKDKLLRALAETENVRKRAVRDCEEATRYATTNFARDMLAVADNLRRAFDSLPKGKDGKLSAEVKGLIEGVKMTEKELLLAFEKHGISKITPLGETFDPSFHQAMFEVETDDHSPGTIVDLMQPGYVMHGRLLRPALVGVAKSKTNNSDDGKVK